MKVLSYHVLGLRLLVFDQAVRRTGVDEKGDGGALDECRRTYTFGSLLDVLTSRDAGRLESLGK